MKIQSCCLPKKPLNELLFSLLLRFRQDSHAWGHAFDVSAFEGRSFWLLKPVLCHPSHITSEVIPANSHWAFSTHTAPEGLGLGGPGGRSDTRILQEGLLRPLSQLPGALLISVFPRKSWPALSAPSAQQEITTLAFWSFMPRPQGSAWLVWASSWYCDGLSPVPSSSDGGTGHLHPPGATEPSPGEPREPGVSRREAPAAAPAARGLPDLGHVWVLPLPRAAHGAAAGDLQPSGPAGGHPTSPQGLDGPSHKKCRVCVCSFRAIMRAQRVVFWWLKW